MKISQFIKDNISNLEHFIEDSGYPIRTRTEESEPLIRLLPKAFQMKDGLLHGDKTKIPANVMAAFWKFKYMEAKSDANKLYNAIDDAYRKANS